MMFQTQQFIQSQISNLQSKDQQNAHSAIIKCDLMKRYKQLSSIYINQQQAHVYDLIAIDEAIDELIWDKLAWQGQLRQSSQKYQIGLVDRCQLMRQCEKNQAVMNQEKEKFKVMKGKLQELKQKKKVIEREIKQNEVMNEKICLQNESLRIECEEQIEKVSHLSLQRQLSKFDSKINKTIQANIETANNLIVKSNQLQNNMQNDRELSLKQTKLKYVDLLAKLQLQNQINNELRVKLNNERGKEWGKEMSLQISAKSYQCRQAMNAKIKNDQEMLESKIKEQCEKNINLQVKLQKLNKFHQQLVKTYGVLTHNYENWKSSDLLDIRQMNRTNCKMQKSINTQRHFLKERSQIVDLYRKYLN